MVVVLGMVVRVKVVTVEATAVVRTHRHYVIVLQAATIRTIPFLRILLLLLLLLLRLLLLRGHYFSLHRRRIRLHLLLVPARLRQLLLLQLCRTYGLAVFERVEGLGVFLEGGGGLLVGLILLLLLG